MKLDLDDVPAWVRDGSVLPLADVRQSTDELNQAPITFTCYGDKGSGLYFEDDGQSFDYEQGQFNEWRIRIDNGQFKAQPTELGYDAPRREFRMSCKGNVVPVVLAVS